MLSAESRSAACAALGSQLYALSCSKGHCDCQCGAFTGLRRRLHAHGPLQRPRSRPWTGLASGLGRHRTGPCCCWCAPTVVQVYKAARCPQGQHMHTQQGPTPTCCNSATPWACSTKSMVFVAHLQGPGALSRHNWSSSHGQAHYIRAEGPETLRRRGLEHWQLTVFTRASQLRQT